MNDENEYTMTFDGAKRWSLNGELHRIGAPAFIARSGRKHWYQNGQMHRMDGPATQYIDGSQEWWINGLFIDFTRLELTVGQTCPSICVMLSHQSIVLVIKQINHTLFQVLVGNKKLYLFSTYKDTQDER